ncbi:MAG: hypothetical protein IDH49_08790 [Gammaproteobacteria bacterium]|nr:hypothetical protein [Gammaproteobacteria bacterium]
MKTIILLIVLTGFGVRVAAAQNDKPAGQVIITALTAGLATWGCTGFQAAAELLASKDAVDRNNGQTCLSVLKQIQAATASPVSSATARMTDKKMADQIAVQTVSGFLSAKETSCRPTQVDSRGRTYTINDEKCLTEVQKVRDEIMKLCDSPSESNGEACRAYSSIVPANGRFK